jgi:hypothetical protein
MAHRKTAFDWILNWGNIILYFFGCWAIQIMLCVLHCLQHGSAIHGSFHNFNSFLYGMTLFHSRLRVFFFEFESHCIHCLYQEYIRRLSNLAIFSLQQQFFATTIACNFNTHRDVLVFFIWSLPKFAAYHWLNVSCVPLYIPLVYILLLPIKI